MREPLPVGKVILGAFLVPWWKRGAFARRLTVPLVLIAALTLSWHYTADVLPQYANSALYCVYLLFFTLFAVRCHRLVLLDAQTTRFEILPEWTWRETRFAVWGLAVIVVFMAAWWLVITAVGMVVFNSPLRNVAETWAQWGITVLKIVPLYMCSRLAMIFPATAIDQKRDFKWAWTITRSNGWRLVIVVGLLPYLLSALVGLLWRDEATIVEALALTLISTGLFAVEIAALSLSYRELTNGSFEQPRPSEGSG
jgi:hypothetical protein